MATTASANQARTSEITAVTPIQTPILVEPENGDDAHAPMVVARIPASTP
jgi:hypothetical protein